tara:strand:+ start:420 stop:2885 length:2466 start_codon:yes stop_codon:yes gene_type:complete
MQEGTRLKLEKLRRLLKAEPQPMSMERAEELFRKAFPDVSDSYKGISKYRNKYPKYFKGIDIAAITDEGDKIRNYLERITKNKTEPFVTSTPKILKAAKADAGPATVKAIVNKFNKGGEKVLLRGGSQFAGSQYDDLYKNSKKFQAYYDQAYDTPWNEAPAYQKANAAKNFKARGAFKPPAGYTLSTEEFLEKVGLKKSSLDTYVSDPDKTTTARFIKDNFDFKMGATAPGAFQAGKGTKQRYWKDPSDATLRKWDRFLNAKVITKDMRDRVESLYANDDVKDLIFKQKKLPSLPLVQTVLNDPSPSKAANAMATLARVLKGDEYKGDINIPKDVVTGKRILDQIGNVGKRNAYRVAFYNAALANVDQLYKNEANSSLSSFKTAFRDELKKILDIPEKGKVPFSVNEVIGISTGEMRGLAPYSAFVDVVRSDINTGPLAQYQGRLSRSIGRVQDALAVNDVKGAQKIADDLIANVPTYKGFRDLSKAQLESLALPEIKIGKKIDPKIFSPDQLAAYKAKGLDIQGMADREGFYLDPKGRKPFFQVSPSQLKKVASNLSEKDKLAVCSLLSRGGLPGDCAAAIDNNPVKAAQVFEQAPATNTGMQKLKAAATGFLRSGGFKTFGAAGLAGGAAAALVKEFRNDDPTTYLSNEDQQKNMLVDMVTQPISEDMTRPDILDFQLPAVGASLAASTALGAPSTIKASRSRGLGVEQKGLIRTSGRVLGRGLGIAASPGVLAPLAALDITRQVSEGDSLADIGTDPLNYTYPIFAEQTDKLTRGLNPTLRKAARLGMSKPALRLLSRAGIAGLGASLAIQGIGLLDD